jgi:hypothetical protein
MPTIVIGYRDPDADRVLGAGWVGMPRQPFPQFRVLDASGSTLAACEIRHCGGTK